MNSSIEIYMKKILFCLTALVVLAACNNKSQQNDGSNAAADENVTEQVETPATVSPDESQDGWGKQSTILSDKPMVVDFFATWCGPCKELEPILEEIEKKHHGEVIFQRIDIDQAPELAQEFRIEAIPMLMFITPSGEYQTIVGVQEPEVIEAKITELLKHSTKSS